MYLSAVPTFQSDGSNIRTGVASIENARCSETTLIARWARWPVKHCSHQIAQLIGREMVAFQVCG
jgi:hypothetical protein